MDAFFPVGSRYYWLTLLMLVICRGMDTLSTWVATPNLELEGNPVMKELGWRWGIGISFALSITLACWPLPAIAISTMSVLVAARNFQSAWLMRSLGEQMYRAWHVERIQETRITLYLFCLGGNTILTAGLGAAVIFFSNHALVPFGIGLGILFYAVAVVLFTVIAIWRIRRASIRKQQIARKLGLQPTVAAELKPGQFTSMCVGEDAQPQGK
jgi:hypothetical protein